MRYRIFKIRSKKIREKRLCIKKAPAQDTQRPTRKETYTTPPQVWYKALTSCDGIVFFASFSVLHLKYNTQTPDSQIETATFLCFFHTPIKADSRLVQRMTFPALRLIFFRAFYFGFAYQSGSSVSFSLASAVIISKAGCVLGHDRSVKGLRRIFSISGSTSRK